MRRAKPGAVEFSGVSDYKLAAVAMTLALAAGCGDFLGGWLTVLRRGRMSRQTLIYATGGAAGFMIGVALLDRIPDLYAAASTHTSAWMLGGFLFIYLLENFFATHAHSGTGHEHAPAGPHDTHHNAEESLYGHGYLEEAMHAEHGHALVSQFQAEDCIITPTASVAAEWGLLLHTTFDGIAIGAGFAESAHTGILMFLAVICHKIPEGFSLASLVLAAGRSEKAALRSALGLGLATVFGAGLAMAFSHVQEQMPHVLLAMATGSFLYIATCDLLPATNRARDRVANLFVILGVVLYALSSSALSWFGLR